MIQNNKAKKHTTKASAGQREVGALKNEGEFTVPLRRFPVAGYNNR